MENPAIYWLITSTIFMLMLTIGVNETWKNLTATCQQLGVLWCSLLAVVVFVPAVAIVLIWAFDLPAAIATGLALVASCPGAPLTSFCSKMAGANVQYVSSLQLALALLAIILAPINLLVFNQLFETQLIRVRSIHILVQIAQVTFLPVVLGLLLQTLAPDFTARIRYTINLLATGLFGLLVVIALAAFAQSSELRGMRVIGWTPLIAITIFTYLVVGVVMGIPNGMFSKTQVKAAR